MLKRNILFFLFFVTLLNAQRLDTGTSSSRDLITLVVISDEPGARQLADIIRDKTKQPTLIYQNNSAVFIGAHNKAIRIPIQDVPSFVHFAHPRYIFAFGSPSALPKSFLSTLEPKLNTYYLPLTNWKDLALKSSKFFADSRISYVHSYTNSQ